ncbi:MAG: alpha/beta fold hydrolase [Anaerolineae bacterium]|nr:alpha/beta fold hydrolase [Anaerolineae bacterium]
MAEQIHQGQPVLTAGPDLTSADAAVILLHGRGASAQGMIELAGYLPQERIVYLAPQAANQTWYPYSGFDPIERNEPYVSSAFQTVADLVERIVDAGIPYKKIVLGGFSQGACLAAEFAVRNPRRYGGLIILSGALMGPPDLPRDYPGSLDGTPVFIGGAERDPWVTEAQLRLTGQATEALGGTVDIEVYPGAEHTIRESEIAHVHAMIKHQIGVE